ncbi:MAG: tRNA (N(6)-L-threonylcarbamoyladenosine(37)-C(2))-methylthiotransferase MtaB [Lachnospiraceae bacterium]|nr:tRNA (N(6)-L-threonylcarbamoyladenosine(37)-C(2))-methylthiotransferase MtaB [Lachnospiraceae bacterium]
MFRTIAFHNLGCKVNTYETEKMIKDVINEGYNVVPFDQKADIYIINTCSVTNIADRKSRQMIHRAKKLNPDAIIVAAGCYVNTHGNAEVIAEGVDICVLNEDKRNIADILNRHLNELDEEEKERERAGVFDGEGCSADKGGIAKGLHTRRFLKVQDGCNAFCSYCIIPYARGRIRSRSIEDVVNEVEEGIRQGYREFIPTGIHVSSYGKDRPEDKEDLAKLIKSISEVKGVRRIRLSSLDPGIISEEFLNTISGIKELCPHFHLSLQSGCDSVLKRMNRHYTAEEYYQKVELLRTFFKVPAITTDIITGFPGETEEEFEDTFNFVKKVGFYETHIFKYSRRKGTPADRMEGQLSEAVKHQRSIRLLELNEVNKTLFENIHIKDGRNKEILFEDIENMNGTDYITGYTKEYIKVYADIKKASEGDIMTGSISRDEKGYIVFT